MAAARQRFFGSLPADELTPMEHALRKALLKAVSTTNGPFPLLEWINRRVGGELESRPCDGGFEIFMRGSNPPASDSKVGGGESKEAFFQRLPDDSFSPAEDALRDAIFEFLATWRSPELATMRDLNQHPEVHRKSQAFLPKAVPLRDWIEHRIGGEIELQGGGKGRPEVVVLTESARATVVAKLRQISGGMPPPMGPCMGPPPPMMHMGGHGGPPPMHGPPPGHMGPPGHFAPPGGARFTTPDAWFQTLPQDELLPGELALREAILNWLKQWPSNRPPTAAPHSMPTLSYCGADAEVKQRRSEILPPKVKLVEWIERRIGGEVELKNIGGHGQMEIHLRGAAPPGAGGPSKQEQLEEFWATLPESEFSEAEEALRVLLLDFLDRWTGSGPPTLGDAMTQTDISSAKKELLPKGVSVRAWIDRRIGGEVETRNDGSKGQVVFGRRGELGASAPAATAAAPAAKRKRMN